MKIIEFFTTFTLKKAIKDIKMILYWLKHDILPKIIYTKQLIYGKTIFEKITLTFTKPVQKIVPT